MSYLVPSSIALTFLTNESGEHKSTSPSMIQVKNQWKTNGIEEKLDVISPLEKCEHTVTYSVMSDFLIVAYVWYMIMLVELQKVLNQDLKWVQQVYNSLFGMNRTQNYECESLTFLLHYKYINILHRNVCTVYSVHMYSTGPYVDSHIVVHYIWWGQSPNPKEVHCFKWEFCILFAQFRFVWCFSAVYPWCNTCPACTCEKSQLSNVSKCHFIL